MNASHEHLLQWLPHRPPFLFLTQVLDFEAGVFGRAQWTVHGTESFLSGHFPGAPLVPGVLITEALAQLCGLVAFHDDRTSWSGMARLAHIDVRFKRAAAPPVVITLHCRMDRVLGGLTQFEVDAHAPAGLIARGRLTIAAGDSSDSSGQVEPTTAGETV